MMGSSSKYPRWMNRMVGVAVAVSLSLAAAARADTALIGSVTSDETKKPLPDPSLYTVRRPVTYYEPSVPDVARACGTGEAEQLSRCPVQFYEVGGDGLRSLDTVDRYQANAQATYLMEFLGYHVMKAGLDAELLSYEQSRSRFWNGGEYLFHQTSWYGRDTLGGFAQDSWTIANRFTVNAGVRCRTTARTPSRSSAPGSSKSPRRCPPASACPTGASRALPSIIWAAIRCTVWARPSCCHAAPSESAPRGSTPSTPTSG